MFLKNNNCIFSRLAFTLAEVLIVLGIIGVIAEMTIPTLQSEFQKKVTITGVQKVYSNLSQSVRLSEAENGPNIDWDWGNEADVSSVKASFDKYWAPYLNIMKNCNTYQECGYSSIQPFKTPSGDQEGMYVVEPVSRTTVVLADGAVLMVMCWHGPSVEGDPNVIAHRVYADLNGAKGPNVYGKDFFQFVLDPAKGIVPDGYNKNYNLITASCNKESSGGQTCGAKLLRDGWQIKDDYPW